MSRYRLMMSEKGSPPKGGPQRRDPVYRKMREVYDLAKEKNIDETITKELGEAIGIAERRELYIDKHCSVESDTLREIRIFTQQKDWTEPEKQGLCGRLAPGMMTGKVEGELLKFLVSMQQAKRILDVGMFTGYSALAMAEAIPPEGVVITCDTEQYLEQINRKKFDETPHGQKIDIRIGHAKDTMLSLADEGQKFDFIFVDANKDSYVDYYNVIMDQGLLAANGTIAFDNAFRGGTSYLTEGSPTDALNRLVEKDPRVRRVLVPIRDGLLLVRRAEETLV
ncbi:O-methyltransferase MdmC-like isoform X1 [Haliotis asinina]|uniref:O-methyltransferase MdmC-like isoform X1 n=2 Tax=Haliotis asinina TaxID=109174 RepID=UPI0035325F61